LLKEELHILYCSPNIIRVLKQGRMRWAEHVLLMREMRNGYKMLIKKTEGNRPLGRSRGRYENNNKVDIKEIGCEDID
jgi:hypothetical protein